MTALKLKQIRRKEDFTGIERNQPVEIRVGNNSHLMVYERKRFAHHYLLERDRHDPSHIFGWKTPVKRISFMNYMIFDSSNTHYNEKNAMLREARL